MTNDRGRQLEQPATPRQNLRRAPRNNSTISSSSRTDSDDKDNDDDDDDNATVVSHSTLHDERLDDDDASEEEGGESSGVPSWIFLQPSTEVADASLPPNASRGGRRSAMKSASLLPVVLSAMEAIGICSGVGAVVVAVLALSVAIAGWVAIVVGALVHGVAWFLWQRTIVSHGCSTMRSVTLRLRELDEADKHRGHHRDDCIFLRRLPVGEQARAIRLLFACWDALINCCVAPQSENASAATSPTTHRSDATSLLRALARGALWTVVMLLYVASGLLLLAVGVLAVGSSTKSVKAFQSSSGAAFAQWLHVPVGDGSVLRIMTLVGAADDPCGVVSGSAVLFIAAAFALTLLLGRAPLESLNGHSTRRLGFTRRIVYRGRVELVRALRFVTGFWDTGLFHMISTISACLAVLAVLVASSEAPVINHNSSSSSAPPPHMREVLFRNNSAGQHVSTVRTSILSPFSPSSIQVTLDLAFGRTDNHSDRLQWVVVWAGVVLGGAVWCAFSASTCCLLWYSQFSLRAAMKRFDGLKQASVWLPPPSPRTAANSSADASSPCHSTASTQRSPTSVPHNTSCETGRREQGDGTGVTTRACCMGWGGVIAGCLGSFLATLVIAVVINAPDTVTSWSEHRQSNSLVAADTASIEEDGLHAQRLPPDNNFHSAQHDVFMFQRFLPFPLSLLWLEAPQWVVDALLQKHHDHQYHKTAPQGAPPSSVCYLPGFTTSLTPSDGVFDSNNDTDVEAAFVTPISEASSTRQRFMSWCVLLFGLTALYHALFWLHLAISLTQWAVEERRDPLRSLSRHDASDLRDVYDDIWIGRYTQRLKRAAALSSDYPVTVQTTNHWRRRMRQSSLRSRASSSLRRLQAQIAKGVKRFVRVLKKAVRGISRRVCCCCNGGEPLNHHDPAAAVDNINTRASNILRSTTSTRLSSPVGDAGPFTHHNVNHEHTRSYSGRPIIAGTRRSIKRFLHATQSSSAIFLNKVVEPSNSLTSSIPYAIDPTVRVAAAMFTEAPTIHAHVLHRATTSRLFAAFVGAGLLVCSAGIAASILLRDATLDPASLRMRVTLSTLQSVVALMFGIGGVLGAPCLIGLPVIALVRRSHGSVFFLNRGRRSIQDASALHESVVHDFDRLINEAYTIHNTSVTANLESRHRRPTKLPPDADDAKRGADLRQMDYFAKLKQQRGHTAGQPSPRNAVDQRVLDTEQLMRGHHRGCETPPSPPLSWPLRCLGVSAFTTLLATILVCTVGSGLMLMWRWW
jgi:hypothetical protein